MLNHVKQPKRDVTMKKQENLLRSSNEKQEVFISRLYHRDQRLQTDPKPRTVNLETTQMHTISVSSVTFDMTLCQSLRKPIKNKSLKCITHCSTPHKWIQYDDGYKHDSFQCFVVQAEHYSGIWHNNYIHSITVNQNEHTTNSRISNAP